MSGRGASAGMLGRAPVLGLSPRAPRAAVPVSFWRGRSERAGCGAPGGRTPLRGGGMDAGGDCKICLVLTSRAGSKNKCAIKNPENLLSLTL